MFVKRPYNAKARLPGSGRLASSGTITTASVEAEEQSPFSGMATTASSSHRQCGAQGLNKAAFIRASRKLTAT